MCIYYRLDITTKGRKLSKREIAENGGLTYGLYQEAHRNAIAFYNNISRIERIEIIKVIEEFIGAIPTRRL